MYRVSLGFYGDFKGGYLGGNGLGKTEGKEWEGERWRGRERNGRQKKNKAQIGKTTNNFLSNNGRYIIVYLHKYHYKRRVQLTAAENPTELLDCFHSIFFATQ